MGTPDVQHKMDTEMKAPTATEADQSVDLNQYRKLVRTYIDMRRYKTALFWAEKVVTLSNAEPMDVYWMAQCMFLLREFHRAAHVIQARGLERTNLYCLYLAAESLFEAKDCPQAIELLNIVDPEAASTSTHDTMLAVDATTTTTTTGDGGGRAELLAAVCVLRGKVLEAMDNRSMAMDAYVQALQHSVYCAEALDALVQHEMLMAWEEHELMTSLPFAQQCSDADAKVLQLLYRSKLKKYYETNCPVTNNVQTPSNYDSMKSIKVLTDRLRTEHNDDLKFNRRTSKFFTPDPRSTILSPANQLLQDLKNTPNYSITSSLSRNSFSQLGESVKSTPTVVTVAPQLPSASSSDEKTAATTVVVPIALSVASRQLEKSVDMMVMRAEKLFYSCEYKKCMQLLDECFKEDPYHAAGLIVQIGCLVELKESNKLFSLAHNLIDLYPDQAIAWYAVGCYYDLNNKSDPARRYLAKAIALDRLFGPAWLAYGHSFAKENEHDQAMAAYFKATQQMRGCHLPLLYIGVESGLTKNHELAERFFYQAMSIAPLDLSVLHELGVVKFEYEEYESAEDILRDTLDMVHKIAKQHGEQGLSPRWEPLLNNLGHCCRKNRKFAEALQFHQRALALKPLCASTYTAIGFVQSLMGRLEDAIESLHRSLSIRRDDVFASTLLRYCTEDLTDEDVMTDVEMMQGTTEGAMATGSGVAAAAAAAALAVSAELPGGNVSGGGGGVAAASGTGDANNDKVSPVKQKLKYDDSDESAGSAILDSSLDMSM